MPTKRTIAGALILAAGLWPVVGSSWAGAGQRVSVRAAVEKQDVFVGEAFVFQIQVDGSDKPGKADLSPLTDFAVEALGGRANNSESVTIVNGQVSRMVQRGYVFQYRLTPKRTGTLAIPAVEVTAEGQTLRTRPIPIRARAPVETTDLKLRLELSKAACYVGEPVILTVTFYFAKDLRSLRFVLPILESPDFASDDPGPAPAAATQPLRVPLNADAVVVRKGQGTLDGKQYTTLSFRKALIAKQAGTFALPKATAVCEALVGRRRPRSIFDDGFFGGGSGVYRTFVVPAASPTLEVKPLPEAGRPAHFAGHVGEFRIEAAAAPTEVNVGDPITLTLRISGPPFLKNVELPPLQEQPALARDFKIPTERAEGKVADGAKVFTQTIRATHDGVKGIPAIELPHFDTKSATYRVARTEPIPLTVHVTKVVTARDAEGRELAPVKSELEALGKGIAHNYEDLSVLESQDYGLDTAVRDPRWLAATGLPFLAYVVFLVGTTAVRRRRADPAAIAARRALRELTRALKPLRGGTAGADASGEVLEALRAYLGRKLRVPGAALTYRDVEGALGERGVAAETLDALRALFEQCEAGRYAGGTAGGDASLPERAMALAKELERSLR